MYASRSERETAVPQKQIFSYSNHLRVTMVPFHTGVDTPTPRISLRFGQWCSYTSHTEMELHFKLTKTVLPLGYSFS
jgi:hypothetical protein